MPRRTFNGTSVASILARIRETLGPDAMVIDVRKVATSAGPRYEALVTTEADEFAAAAPAAERAVAPKTAASGRALRGAKGRREGAAQLRIALVGPTGAGKTTTIAKLASHPSTFGGRATGLLCLDAFRIGAIEQSRSFARLARLPLEVAAEPDEVASALHRLRRCEVVLIDTAGRGPAAQADRESTRRMLEAAQPSEVHLLLPASLRTSYARQAVAEHRSLGLTHLLPAKVDECPDDDWLFVLAARESLPIRWVAAGHRVPEDLYDAQVGGLRARVLGEWSGEVGGVRGRA